MVSYVIIDQQRNLVTPGAGVIRYKRSYVHNACMITIYFKPSLSIMKGQATENNLFYIPQRELQ